MNAITRTITAAVVGVLAIGALAACSADADAVPEPQTSASVTSPAAPEPQASTPAPSVAPEPTGPVADEFSQVVGGVLFQGTERAPVKIGDDTPGRPPAIDATVPDQMVSGDAFVQTLGQIIDSGKYAVLIGPSLNSQNEPEGFNWTTWRRNEYGNIKAIDNLGGTTGDAFPTIDAAMAGPFTADGRVLDRAEYVIILVLE
ncbi:hypothetical protein [Cellulomonas hominis]